MRIESKQLEKEKGLRAGQCSVLVSHAQRLNAGLRRSLAPTAPMSVEATHLREKILQDLGIDMIPIADHQQPWVPFRFPHLLDGVGVG